MNWIRLASSGMTSNWTPTTAEQAIPVYGFLHAHQIAPGGRLRFDAWGTTSQIAASSTTFRVRPLRIAPGQATSDGQPLLGSTASVNFVTAASGIGGWHFGCDVVISRSDLTALSDINAMGTASYNWSTTGELATTSNPTIQGIPTTTSISLDADSLVFLAVTIGNTSTLAQFTPKYACISLVDSYHDQGVFACLS